MDSSELRDGLMRIGLTQYEADAYVALLELGSAPAVDVARTADVPRARIYDVIRSLAEEGYVETFEDDGLNARAVEPSVALTELEDAVDHLQTTAEEIEDRWKEPPIENRQISVLKRMDTLYRLARERIEAAEFEVKIGATPEQFAELAETLAGLDDVVVKVTLHGGDEREVTRSRDELRELVGDVPTETRVRSLPTSLLIVIDHREVVFAPNHTMDAGEQGLFLDDPWVAEMGDWFFRTAMWATWDSIQATRSTLPATYTDIRECLQHVGPLIEDGADVRAAVRPIDDPDRRLVGEIVDVDYRRMDGDQFPLEAYVSVAAFTLETDDGRYTVGNWDGILEDVAAGSVTILDVVE